MPAHVCSPPLTALHHEQADDAAAIRAADSAIRRSCCRCSPWLRRSRSTIETTEAISPTLISRKPTANSRCPGPGVVRLRRRSNVVGFRLRSPAVHRSTPTAGHAGRRTASVATGSGRPAPGGTSARGRRSRAGHRRAPRASRRRRRAPAIRARLPAPRCVGLGQQGERASRPMMLSSQPIGCRS